MSRSSSLIVLGVLTMLTPFSGLPSAFRTFLTLLVGAIALGIGVAERAERARASLPSAAPAPNAPAP
ncbi:hypothetical protein HY091_01055 [Candidatus Kaiserbacteria bacterium]|nr:hypothetical protein [Candidatus Kaiserbacteria bacterium]